MNMKRDYEYKELNTRNIFIDPLYQRDLDNTKVQKIIKNFNHRLLNPLKVSFRDGHYYVFDGQHTRAALIRMNNGQDCNVECKVYYGLTRLDEMELFILQNGESSPVSVAEKFRALWKNGDPDVSNMVRACERAGIICDFTRNRARNKCICYRTLFKYYKLLGTDNFIRMLSAIRETWNGDGESFSNEIVAGYGELFLMYGCLLDQKRLIRKLSSISCAEIVREGKIGLAPGGKKFARVILREYNRNLKSGGLEDRF